MLRVLSRRWWGVSGWVYLLALSLAACMYWILPGSCARLQWSFKGFVSIRGFSDDHSSLVVEQEHEEETTYLFLNLETGKETTFNSDRLPDYNPLDLLANDRRTYTARYDLSNPTAIRVKPHDHSIQSKQTDVETGSLTKTNVEEEATTDRLEQLDRLEKIVEARYKRLGLPEDDVLQTVRTYGSNICVDNQQTMLLTKRHSPDWHRAWVWLKKKCKWKTDFDKDWNFYRVVLYNLTTGKMTETPIRLNHRPYFAVHPKGNGFAILDKPESPRKEITKLSWYNLPPDSVSLTWIEWCFVAGTFVLSLILASLPRLFHRLKRTPVAALPRP